MTNSSTETRAVTDRRSVDEIVTTIGSDLINTIKNQKHGSISVAHLYNGSHRVKNSVEQQWIRNFPTAGKLLLGLLAVTGCLAAAGHSFIGVFVPYRSVATLQRRFIILTIAGGGFLTVILVAAAVRTPDTRVWHRNLPDTPVVVERIVSTESNAASITVDSPRKVPMPYEMAKTSTEHGIETCDMDGRSLLETSYVRRINRHLPEQSDANPADSSASSITEWPLIQVLQSVMELSCPWEIRVSMIGGTELRGNQNQRDAESGVDTQLRCQKGAQVSIQLLVVPPTEDESAVRTQLTQLPSLPIGDDCLYVGEPRKIPVSETEELPHVAPQTGRTTQSGHRCRYAVGVTDEELLQVLTVPKGVDPAVDDLIETRFGGQPRTPPDSGVQTTLDAAADTDSAKQSSADTLPHDASDDEADGDLWEPHTTDND